MLYTERNMVTDWALQTLKQIQDEAGIIFDIDDETLDLLTDELINRHGMSRAEIGEWLYKEL